MPKYIPQTRKQLDFYLNYDPDIGAFTWEHNNYGRKAGDPVRFKLDRGGHPIVCLRSNKLPLKNLAWLWAYDYWPTHVAIKHVNMDKTDLRIRNLVPRNLATHCTHPKMHGWAENKNMPVFPISPPESYLYPF